MVAGTGAARVVAGIGVWGHCYVLSIRGPTRRTTVFRHRLDDVVMPVGQAQRKGERLPSGARPGDWRSCGAVHVAYDNGLVVHHTRRCGVAVKLSYTFAVRRDSDRVEAMDRPVFGLSNRRRRRSCLVAVGGPIRWRRSGRPRSSRCWSRCRDCGRSFCSGRCGAAIPSCPRVHLANFSGFLQADAYAEFAALYDESQTENWRRWRASCPVRRRAHAGSCRPAANGWSSPNGSASPAHLRD